MEKQIIQSLGLLLINEYFELYVSVSVFQDDHPDEHGDHIAARLGEEFEPLVQALILTSKYRDGRLPQ